MTYLLARVLAFLDSSHVDRSGQLSAKEHFDILGGLTEYVARSLS